MDEVTFLDQSPGMIDVARRKWRELIEEEEGKGVGREWRVRQMERRARFVVGNVVEKAASAQKEATELKLSRREKRNSEAARSADRGVRVSDESSSSSSNSNETLHPPYDTILATFSLCSTPTPVIFLQSLAKLCHPPSAPPSSPPYTSSNHSPSTSSSKILLIDHGRSHYRWLNSLLDRTAPPHARRHGCWWNRDIGEIIRESGLEVTRLERRQFGTLWIIEARAPAAAAVDGVQGKDGVTREG